LIFSSNDSNYLIFLSEEIALIYKRAARVVHDGRDALYGIKELAISLGANLYDIQEFVDYRCRVHGEYRFWRSRHASHVGKFRPDGAPGI
jgi:hypothetical protein